jgi:lathosterol oxidase
MIQLFYVFLIIFTAMLLRYFGLAGLMYWVCLRTKKTPLSHSRFLDTQVKRDIYWSILSTLIFAIMGTYVFDQWQKGNTQIYDDISDYGLIYWILSLPLVLVIQDTYFYWTHRLLHHKNFFHPFHSAHHQSRIPSAWTSFAFHPVEALIQALILPLILIFIPIHFSVLILFLLLMTFFGIFNHLGYEFLPRSLEYKLGVITATHHHIHHQKVSQNYGLFFNWWDQWFGTESRH